MVPIGVLELDKVSHMSFDTLLRRAVAPIDSFGCELGPPLGKLFRPFDVEPHIAQERFRGCPRCNAMLILVRPHIRDLSVRRSGRRTSEHTTPKFLESFPLRHAHRDPHNTLRSRHGRPSYEIFLGPCRMACVKP